MKKITVIGAGNIGGATAIGLSRSGAAMVTATTQSGKNFERFAPFSITTSTDNASAVKGADFVCFAVKPWLMEEVVKEVVPHLDFKNQTIVSFAPGIKPEELQSWLGPKARLAYVIPNTAIEFGESVTFIAPISTTAEETALLKEIFGKAGSAFVVKPEMLVAGTSLASCGIAYALRYISASSKGGAGLGFAEDESTRIVVQTVKGACALLDARGGKPEAEIDKVTTPGGMTLKGLEAMEKAGFTESVIKGLEANK